ncbi:unnamed protein product, partial [Prorocentrum cordatum]
QTTLQVLVIKWARAEGRSGPQYLASTVVLFTEVLKTCVSFALVASESGGVAKAGELVVGHFTRDPLEALKICVPSLLYARGVRKSLPVPGALLLPGAAPAVAAPKAALLAAGWGAGPPGGEEALGFVAVLAACFTSGLASVYLEKLLKQTDASIGERAAHAQDASPIADGGLTQGYTVRVVCVIATNALGGLLCAAVLKYADNILRCFSTALSIVLTCVVSFAVLQEETLDLLFVAGAVLAIAATFMYSAGLPVGLGLACQPGK